MATNIKRKKNTDSSMNHSVEIGIGKNDSLPFPLDEPKEDETEQEKSSKTKRRKKEKIASLLHIILTSSSSSPSSMTTSLWKKIESLVEEEPQSVLESYLWPLFFHTNVQHSSIDLNQVAYSMAILLQCRYHWSSPSFSFPLSSITTVTSSSSSTTSASASCTEEKRYRYTYLDFVYQNPMQDLKPEEEKDKTNVSCSCLKAFSHFVHSLLKYSPIPSIHEMIQWKRMSSTCKMTFLQEQTIKVQFFILAFQSMESSSFSSSSKKKKEREEEEMNVVVLPTLQDMVHIGVWKFMSSRYREYLLGTNTIFEKRWKEYHDSATMKTDEKTNVFQQESSTWTEQYIPQLVRLFLYLLQTYRTKQLEQKQVPPSKHETDEEKDQENEDKEEKMQVLAFLHVTLQFLLDILSIPFTRRYVRHYLLSVHFSVHCTCSSFWKEGIKNHHMIDTTMKPTYAKASNATRDNYNKSILLFVQLVHQLQERETFGIDDITSAPLTSSQMVSMYHERASILQKMVHRYYSKDLPDLVYASVVMICGSRMDYHHPTIEKENNPLHFLKKQFDQVMDWRKVLLDLAHRLRLLDKTDMILTDSKSEDDRDDDDHDDDPEVKDHLQREYVTQVLLYHHILRPSEIEILQYLPIFPDESLLWNPHLVPPGHTGLLSRNTTTLALPKLNTQFLTFGDYLVRVFTLLRLESAYEIRSDLVDVIKRMRPSLRHTYGDSNLQSQPYNQSNHSLVTASMSWDIPTHDEEESEYWRGQRLKTEFHGWSRMGIELSPLSSCQIIKVSPPKLGEAIPSQVLAEICWDLGHCNDVLKQEWDGIGEFDNLFLVAVDATAMMGGCAPTIDNVPDHIEDLKYLPDEDDVTFPQRFGVLAVRGCTVLEVRDEAGSVLNDTSLELEGNKEEIIQPKGNKRFLKVELDPVQYAADATGKSTALGTNIYRILNIAVRRHGKENNFKAILETVRGLMIGASSINRSIPVWLRSIFLGYGDPSAASYRSQNMQSYALKTPGVTPMNASHDYCDTFLDENHLRESFPGCAVIVDGRKSASEKVNDRRQYRIKIITNTVSDCQDVVVTSYPFHNTNTQGNSIRFTPMQVEAIRSGMSPGLTLVVGPPGTGKTDVAVQIIANLYHSFPMQRTVMITHSNAALNDWFGKIMLRGDIDERFMIRLGSGERNLQISSDHDFTKIGRVKHSLARRAYLLEQVQLLSESLGICGAAERGSDGSPSYTCETAEYFRLHQYQKKKDFFLSRLESMEQLTAVEMLELFPFKKYFAIDHNLNYDSITLKEKITFLDSLFLELAEYRPLELLRSQRQRSDYLVTKQARIVAMTCTHAAIMRSYLVELGFRYDNIIIEEAGQMLDVETFIPFLLQKNEVDEGSTTLPRLKRICLIGDHHQLPPVVKNVSIMRYSRLDQSLFARFVSQGIPSICLNKQGRARPEIAQLYSWRYNGLGTLDHIYSTTSYTTANAGFVHTFQLINCEDFEGRGESTPSPYFYQNLGEAEYAVAVFQYMVMIGYPPEKISLLTTYNGQKDLLLEILSRRCGDGTPLTGIRPGSVSTVDQYQGQQNDYVILSLVRTKAVGHLRDMRRLVVATSRARLGLYILCRQSLFSTCRELQRTMDLFRNRSSKLELVVNEHYPTRRMAQDSVDVHKKFIIDDVVKMGQIVYEMQGHLAMSSMEKEVD